jgi:hypothetical protein
MPPKWLRYIDVPMKKAFPQKGSLRITNLYDILRKESKSYCSIDWPNVISSAGRQSLFRSHGSDTVQRITRKMLKLKHDFLFTHFFDLDYIAHDFGTKSRQIRDGVKRLDEMLESLEQRDMMVFSDHGMIDVKGHVDILPVIEEIGLEFGKDMVYFLDSTMVRFWFRKAAFKDVFMEKLKDLAHGHVLRDEEIKDVFRLPHDHCDLIFLADPGYVIRDNFFQGDDEVKAMHGYDPRQKDQLAFHMFRADGGKKKGRMVDMLPTILEYMKIPGGRFHGKSLL